MGAILADVTAPIVIGGGGAVLLLLFGQMFLGMRRVDEGTWAIIRDRDKQIIVLTKDRDHWRDRYLELLQRQELEEGKP